MTIQSCVNVHFRIVILLLLDCFGIQDYRYFAYFPFDVENQYVSYHNSAETIQIIANRCQGRAVISLFSNMTL
jgi:hypothetical protein